MTKAQVPTTRPRSVIDALMGDLDDETRARHGLARPGPVMPAGRNDSQAITNAPPPDIALTDLRLSDAVFIGKGVLGQIVSDRVSAVAGGITFFGLLSLFPALTSFVSLYGLFADPLSIAGHLDLMQRFLPAGALDLIRNQISAITAAPETALTMAGVIGLLVAFYSANGGVKALLSALNVAFFKTETRSFIWLNLVAMSFTMGGLILIGLMLCTIAVIPILLRYLHLGGTSEMLVSLLRWPLMFVVLIGALAAIYRYGPAAPNYRWRWISPGAIFAGTALVLTSVLFSWYAANFANYNETYGSLGAVVGLMMWLWLSAMIVLIGAEINSEIERRVRQLAGVLEQDRIQASEDAAMNRTRT